MTEINNMTFFTRSRSVVSLMPISSRRYLLDIVNPDEPSARPSNGGNRIRTHIKPGNHEETHETLGKKLRNYIKFQGEFEENPWKKLTKITVRR